MLGHRSWVICPASPVLGRLARSRSAALACSRSAAHKHQAQASRDRENRRRKRRQQCTHTQAYRMGSRAGCLPCCGKGPVRCKCWYKESATKEDQQIMAMLSRRMLNKMVVRICEAEILTYNDTADMPHFLQSFQQDCEQTRSTRQLVTCTGSYMLSITFI